MLTSQEISDTKEASMDAELIVTLRARRTFLQGKEKLILDMLNAAKTDFERGRAFGEHEIIENELFFLDQVLSENVVQEMNDLNVDSNLDKIVAEDDRLIEISKQLRLNLTNNQT